MNSPSGRTSVHLKANSRVRVTNRSARTFKESQTEETCSHPGLCQRNYAISRGHSAHFKIITMRPGGEQRNLVDF